jgi:nicotinate-nucleotide adenylyltransferase
MQKLAIFGGAFNPVHWGHVQIAETALHQANLDAVLWVPSYRSPHKDQTEMLSFNHRLAMVQLAIADQPQFSVSTIEQELVEQAGHQPKQPVYAVETLRALQMLYPQTQWYWVIGLDTLQTLPRWYGAAEVAQSCIWLLAPRPVRSDLTSSVAIAEQTGLTVAQWFGLQSIQLQWQVLSMPWVPISSSQVRYACQNHHSIDSLVPDPVRDYLLTHHLYQSAN